MAAPQHLAELECCPFLPVPGEPLAASCLTSFSNDRGREFYLAALTYAHSLWLQGFPARAILLINRALGADLAARDPVLTEWPLPYAAAAWILTHHRPDQFIGNPRRHWQHLATRMVEPRRELRTWRAWACWHLARIIMPDLPADEIQIVREGIAEPSIAEITEKLIALGHPGEADAWRESWRIREH